jgi:acetyltransferase
VLVPATAVPLVLEEAAAAGARSATVMTSGFGEAGDEVSAALERRLRGVIATTGLAVSGPNCLGNMNAFAKFMTMPDDRPQRVAPGPVAIIGQSGGIAMAIKRTLEERGVDTGVVITSGNESGLTTADYIAYFASRPEIKVIVSYLESVRDAPSFLAACRSARATGKPVVVVKLGASDHGREAALAHTGRLAGSMQAFDAVAGPAGVIRVPISMASWRRWNMPCTPRCRRAPVSARSRSRAACAGCCSTPPRRTACGFLHCRERP